jgi:hypothetical protein
VPYRRALAKKLGIKDWPQATPLSATGAARAVAEAAIIARQALQTRITRLLVTESLSGLRDKAMSISGQLFR